MHVKLARSGDVQIAGKAFFLGVSVRVFLDKPSMGIRSLSKAGGLPSVAGPHLTSGRPE